VLRDWLATSPAPPRIFNEPLLRVLFADQADTSELRNALAGLKEALEAQMSIGRAYSREYLQGDGPFPERAHLIAMFTDLNHRLVTAVHDWVEDSVREVSSWPTTKSLGLTDSAREVFDRAAAP
jgi:hypothetical protein